MPLPGTHRHGRPDLAFFGTAWTDVTFRLEAAGTDAAFWRCAAGTAVACLVGVARPRFFFGVIAGPGLPRLVVVAGRDLTCLTGRAATSVGSASSLVGVRSSAGAGSPAEAAGTTVGPVSFADTVGTSAGSVSFADTVGTSVVPVLSAGTVRTRVGGTRTGDGDGGGSGSGPGGHRGGHRAAGRSGRS